MLMKIRFDTKTNGNDHCFSLDHAKGSHGMAGLYFKYDVSALKVIVKPDQEGFMHFLIRISSVVAGIIVISGKYRNIIKS